MNAQRGRWMFAALWASGVDPRLSEPVPPGRTRAVWTQRDGTRIRVVDMDDAHVLHTIEMLKRASERRRLRDILRLDEYASDHDTVAADMALDEALALGHSTNPADYYPIYHELVADARARGLAVNPDAITIYQQERIR